MKLVASATPFESIPPKHWECIRRELNSVFAGWGIALEIEEALSVREAEARFREWLQRPGRDG